VNSPPTSRRWASGSTAVCPGEINTAILSPGTDQLVSRIPMRRLGSPTEVAPVIYYLCSYLCSARPPT